MPASSLIYTGSWRGGVDTEKLALISISRSAPRGRRGFLRYAALCPGIWFRDPMPDELWAARYKREILARLDPAKVVEDIADLAGGRPAVLMCWEPPPPNRAWCHRALVSLWLQERLGLDVPEIDHEHLGCGCLHPKLPPNLL